MPEFQETATDDSDVTLDITGVVAGGDGIGRQESGRVVFVTGAMPSERVTIRITDERRDFARGEVDRILTPSPDRVVPPCAFRIAGCGGCEWQHIAPHAQPGFKRDLVVDALRRIARIDEPNVADCVALAPQGYRTTVRVAIDSEGRPAFRKSLSHDLVTVDDCLVAHPTLAAMLCDARWPGAKEAVLRVGARTGEVLVDVKPLPDGFATPTFFHEEAAGRMWQISAGSFFQIRPDGADELARLVVDALAAHQVATVVDLYSGVGLFAGALHERGFDVRAAVEGGRFAAADARVNLEGVCDVIECDVAKWRGIPVDAVVADPSRRGLMTEGVATIERCAPRTVVLVSCDVAALGRDAKLLVAAGFALDHSTPLDLFPHTPHVEVVSTFVRL
ncbi:MAG: class I SAM-dependent RNA methyltransferase [Actinobacteria bacterium]|nr:class I SAM-dependent RNA methyltransferase [Actinomycetota bacterium]